MNLRPFSAVCCLIFCTSVACSGTEDGDGDGDGDGDAASGGQLNGSGGKDASGGHSSATGGTGSGGKGEPEGSGGSGSSLEDRLDQAAETCTPLMAEIEVSFGEDDKHDVISQRQSGDEDTLDDETESIVRDTLLGNRIELTWDLPVADGETTPVTGYLRYEDGLEVTYSKCFTGVARIRTEGYGGLYYVFASEDLSYADADGNCESMPETGWVQGCISDKH